MREATASKLVDRFAIWSGVAGLIPMPLRRPLRRGGLQIQMVRRLSQIYDVPFSENSGKAVIASLAGSMIPATSGLGAASMLKFVPILGTLASGFVMPVLASGATYAIGKAFVQHFATGGTLLDFNAPDYREFIRAQKEMWDLAIQERRRQVSGNEFGDQFLIHKGRLSATPGVMPPADAQHSEPARLKDSCSKQSSTSSSACSRDFAASTAKWAFSARFSSRSSQRH